MQPVDTAPATEMLDEMAERLRKAVGATDSTFLYRNEALDVLAFTLTGLPSGPARDAALADILARIAPGAAPAGEEVPRSEIRLKAALFAYLMENSAYSYPEDFVNPSPPEFGISWEWQATTPKRPNILDVLISDATKWLKDWLSDIDIDAEPQDYDREMLDYADALQVPVAPVVRARLAAPSPARSDRAGADLRTIITDALQAHSSPTIGRGDVHGGQPGWIVYEGSLPAIVAAIGEGAGAEGREDGTTRLCLALYGRKEKPSDYLGGSNARMLHDAADRLSVAMTGHLLPGIGRCTDEMAHAMSRLDGYDHDRDMPTSQRWKDYWDAALAAAPTPAGEGAGLDAPLPCDVKVQPATIIRKGVPLRTLLIALEQRRKWISAGSEIPDWPNAKPAPASEPDEALRVAADLTPAARDVLAERRRQVEAEGWSLSHDRIHTKGQLADAAASYAIRAHEGQKGNLRPPASWPFGIDWWKPSKPRRMLVKAGALILAEIERLDRRTALDGASEGEGA